MKEVEERKKVARFDNKIIEENLIKFEKKLTINQQKLLYYLIIQEKNGNSLQNITWNELQKELGLMSGEKYSQTQKKNFIQEMTSIKLFIKIDEERMASRVIFPNFEIYYNKINYTINEAVIELFDQPALEYYLMNYELIQHFRHDYSIRIYEMLNKRIGANDKSIHNFPYNIDELRTYLDLQENEYSEVKDFRKRVLEPSLQEISELTDIKVAGKYNAKTKKMQLSSKKWGEDVIYIRGISRKTTTQEYVQEQFDNAVLAKENGRTKINRETKISNEVNGDRINNEVTKNIYGEFKHVLLSKEQYEQALSLFANEAELNKAIVLLDEYFEQMPDMVNKFTNHYISLKRFSKNIIDAQNAKAKQKGSYNYNNQSKDVYVEPTYDKFTKDHSPKLSLEEIKDLLDDPFGSGADEEMELTEKATVTYTENEQSKSATIHEEPQADEVLIKERPYQHLEDSVHNGMSSINMIEEPLLGMVENLYLEVERLYFSFYDGQIDTEMARKELEKKEAKYEHKLTSEEKYELNRIAQEKWSAIPF